MVKTAFLSGLCCLQGKHELGKKRWQIPSHEKALINVGCFLQKTLGPLRRRLPSWSYMSIWMGEGKRQIVLLYMRVSVGRKVDVVYEWKEGRPVLMEGGGKVLTHIGGDSTEDSGQGGDSTYVHVSVRQERNGPYYGRIFGDRRKKVKCCLH